MEYILVNNPNGMVDKEVFVKKIMELKMLYPNWKIDTSSSETMKLLYKYLGYAKNEAFIKGIDEYIENESNNPTVAGLKKYYTSYDCRCIPQENNGVFRFTNTISIDPRTEIVSVFDPSTGRTQLIPFEDAGHIIKRKTDVAVV